MNQEKANISLLKNTLLNFSNHIVTILVAIIALPLTIKGLGSEQYGVLSLIWAIVGYSSFLELGLSRALTKYASLYIKNAENEKLNNAVWNTFIFQLILGIIAGAIFLFLSPYLLKILNIPINLLDEAKKSFYLVALMPTIIFCTSCFIAVLMANLRFDWLNFIQASSNFFNYTLVAIGASFFKLGLLQIMFIMVMIKLLTLFVLALFSLIKFPSLRKLPSYNFETVKPLFSFGGWSAITSTFAQVLTKVDSFFISNLLSPSWVTYYSVAYDSLGRILIIPGSLVTTLFPTLSSLTIESIEDRKIIEQLYVRSTKYLFILMIPLTLVLYVFAKDILILWMGTEIAEKSTLVFKILSIAIPLSSLSWIPNTLLQSSGRPDLTAKLLFFESTIYILSLWIMVRNFGIEGAAFSWLMRSSLSVLLHFFLVSRLKLVKIKAFLENGFSSLLFASFMLILLMLLLVFVREDIFIKLILVFIFNLFFALTCWFYVLDIVDKEPITLLINKLR
jgi:O-antigen/teichoic acid export membrane protein